MTQVMFTLLVKKSIHFIARCGCLKMEMTSVSFWIIHIKIFFSKMAVRFVPILQTKGLERFSVHLSECSFVVPVPYKVQGLGVIAPFIPMILDFFQHWTTSKAGNPLSPDYVHAALQHHYTQVQVEGCEK